jgi:Na+/H+ antiporter NhaC
MEKIFGVLIILTLAWATGAIMNAVGLSELLRSVSVPAICHIVNETN